MEVSTIVKANIKTHRAQFVGVVIMMIIAVIGTIGFSSVIGSVDHSLVEEYDAIDGPDLIMMENSWHVTDEVLSALDECETIKDYSYSSAVGVHKISVTNGTEDQFYPSSTFLIADDGSCPVINDDFSGLMSERPVLNRGEIYVASGITETINANVGDKVTVRSESSSMEFTIKGLIEQPLAASTIGWKIIYVCQEDFDEYYDMIHSTYDGMGYESDYDFTLLTFHKADPNMSDMDFNKSINKASGLLDVATGEISRNMILNFSGMMVTVVSSILVGIAVILFIVLLVVVAHNIGTSVKTDYKQLGIYKSQGFDSKKLRLIYLWQYMTAEIIGMGIGLVGAYLFLMLMLKLFAPLVGFAITPRINILFAFIVCVAVLIISAIAIYICTAKIGKISPQKAISEGRDDVSFSSKIQFPISKRLLSASVATRNITSSIGQYVGTVITAMILSCFAILVFLGNDTLSAKNTWLSISQSGELEIYNYGKLSSDEVEDVYDIVSSHANVQDMYSYTTYNVSCEETKVFTFIYEEGNQVKCIVDGRAPIYDNEIAVGVGIISATNKNIGDTLTLTNGDKSYEYLIVGCVNTTSDAGNIFCLGMDAGRHIGLDDRQDYMTAVFVLENPDDPNEWYPYEDTQVIADELRDYITDGSIRPTAIDSDYTENLIGSVIRIVQIAVVILAIVFVLIIVAMACTKSFNIERKMLGIYKAMGFTSMRLRLQFAIRYALVFAFGSGLGIIVSKLAVKPFYNSIFGTLGCIDMPVNFTLEGFLYPVIIVVGAAFVGALLASRKIKKVDVNVLVTE